MGSLYIQRPEACRYGYSGGGGNQDRKEGRSKTG